MRQTRAVGGRRHYFGFIADSARWDAIALRDDDIVISTPSKCGTTWTQMIVALLVFGSPDLPAPLSELSPWVDMQIRTTDELVALVEAQQHRRFLKTHTPLDGLPVHPGVTYLTVFRHPLDVALSDLDHTTNVAEEIFRLRADAVGDKDLHRLPTRPPRPGDPADHLRQFIEQDVVPTGSGPYSLSDFCGQLDAAWARRGDPGVHLLRYADLCRDLDGEMRRVATVLGITVDEERWPALVDAARFDAMRDRAGFLAPDATRGIWQDDAAFFAHGGERNWRTLLDPAEQAAFAERFAALGGPAAAWLLAP